MVQRRMREQDAQQPPLKRRASAEHYELMRRMQEPGTDEEEVPDVGDERLYMTRAPNSARRYYTSNGNQVIRQGNRQIIIHEEPPPKRKTHWLLFIGLGMLAMVALWVVVQLIGAWWTNEQLNATYQYPRMYQTDEVVGHSDSTDNPTHFIFENLRGQILIIELPGGDYTHAKIYPGPKLYADNADQIPVTAEFKDVNGDGKVDIILHIQDQRVVFLNTGAEFKEQ